ncbi:tumor necrosis factor receptor superfamily member 5 isoform X2 [Carettochelys insculpta]|uniref:tumor necrosis factor receptor superfamily member 5 isoform X2 n=1 Tax=Carettochelys insculpta TaxID=44489 RepID=UPI003EBC2F14
MPGCLLCLLGCLLCHGVSSGTLNCSANQYEHKGMCCKLCEPGHKLKSECTEQSESSCQACEAGHFQHLWTKERHCIHHTYCDPNAGLVVRSPGNATSNVLCECKEGMYCSGSDCQTCLSISPCRPGEGVTQKASSRLNTVCAACKWGTFSNTTSFTEPCRPWTSCEALGLVLKANGTNVSDATCEPRRSRPLGLGLGLIPIAITVACLVGLSLICCRKGCWISTQKPPEPVEVVLVPPPKQGCEEHDERQDFPVQETLLGRQPVAQEDGKESRISEQERL